MCEVDRFWQYFGYEGIRQHILNMKEFAKNDLSSPILKDSPGLPFVESEENSCQNICSENSAVVDH